jgi:hypothetical protein
MRKYLTIILWMIIGSLISGLLGALFPSFLSGDFLSLIGTIIFLTCLYIGFRKFTHQKYLELSNTLVENFFYEVDVVKLMSKQEISLRLNFHKNNLPVDIKNLSFQELIDQNTSMQKSKKNADYEARVKGIKANVQAMKESAVEIKKASREIKESFSELSKVKQQITDGFKHGETLFANSSAKSEITNAATGNVNKFGYSNTGSGSVENNVFYANCVHNIRVCEENIVSVKTKVEEAQRSFEKYSSVGDAYNMRLANVWRDDKLKLQLEVSQLEKKLNELVKQRKLAEDIAK